MTDDVVRLISIFGVLVLVGSGLMRRGLDKGSASRLALIWIAIIVAAWGAVILVQHARAFFA